MEDGYVPCIVCKGPIGVAASHKYIGCGALIHAFCGSGVVVDGEIEEGFGARRHCGCRRKTNPVVEEIEKELTNNEIFYAATKKRTVKKRKSKIHIPPPATSSTSTSSSTSSSIVTLKEPTPYTPGPATKHLRKSSSERTLASISTSIFANPILCNSPSESESSDSGSESDSSPTVEQASIAKLGHTTPLNFPASTPESTLPSSYPGSALSTSTPGSALPTSTGSINEPGSQAKIDVSEKAKLQSMLICLAGNEVMNGPVGKEESDLQPAILLRYQKWIQNLDSDYPQLQKSSIYNPTVLMMNEKKEFTGKAFFRKFGEHKCEIVNQYNPLWREEK